MNLDKLKDPYVIILIGPPLSGKTTWINKNFEPGSFELISRDQIVLDLHGKNDYNTAFKTVDQKEVDNILVNKIKITKSDVYPLDIKYRLENKGRSKCGNNPSKFAA